MVLSNNQDSTMELLEGSALSSQIFSLLESHFLVEQEKKSSGKVRILSIDGGGIEAAMVATKTLMFLEQCIIVKTGDNNVNVSDYFDLAIGTGVGGLIAAMLFSDDGTGRPLYKASDVYNLLKEESAKIFKAGRKPSLMAKLSGIKTSSTTRDKVLSRVFKDKNGRNLTLKDTLKPLLVPCYDLQSGAPFLFSRTDALENDAFDFSLSTICRATMTEVAGQFPVVLKSVDGRTGVTAIGGAVVMNNPTSVAITHVLHNKHEFPLVNGVDSLFVLSLGTAQSERSHAQLLRGRGHVTRPLLNIVSDGISDTVDHSLALAFANNPLNYLRIQAMGLPGDIDEKNVKMMSEYADRMLRQKGIETVPFGGKRKLSVTNAERLESFVEDIVAEQQARARRSIPNVHIKQITPRMSSAQSPSSLYSPSSSSASS